MSRHSTPSSATGLRSTYHMLNGHGWSCKLCSGSSNTLGTTSKGLWLLQHRFASRRNCQALVSGIDWTTASKATKRPRPHTSALGTKRPSGSRMAPAPNCAPSVKFRRHRSTSFGCANGTTTKSTKGYKTRWKSLSGLTGGDQKSHRTTSIDHSAWQGMAVGNLLNHFHYNRGKGFQSLSMPLPRQETNELRPGSMPSAFMATL